MGGLLLKLRVSFTGTSRRMDISWISHNREWPKTPRALSDRLNEVIPNLRDIGIIVHREYDKHRKSDTITISNNNYQPPESLDSNKPTDSGRRRSIFKSTK